MKMTNLTAIELRKKLAGRDIKNLSKLKKADLQSHYDKIFGKKKSASKDKKPAKKSASKKKATPAKKKATPAKKKSAGPSVTELKAKCKERNIKGYSKLNRQQLLDILKGTRKSSAKKAKKSGSPRTPTKKVVKAYEPKGKYITNVKNVARYYVWDAFDEDVDLPIINYTDPSEILVKIQEELSYGNIAGIIDKIPNIKRLAEYVNKINYDVGRGNKITVAEIKALMAENRIPYTNSMKKEGLVDLLARRGIDVEKEAVYDNRNIQMDDAIGQYDAGTMRAIYKLVHEAIKAVKHNKSKYFQYYNIELGRAYDLLRDNDLYRYPEDIRKPIKDFELSRRQVDIKPLLKIMKKSIMSTFMDKKPVVTLAKLIRVYEISQKTLDNLLKMFKYVNDTLAPKMELGTYDEQKLVSILRQIDLANIRIQLNQDFVWKQKYTFPGKGY